MKYSAFFMGLVVAAFAGGAHSQPQGYYDIPAGFDFPANKQTLEQFRRDANLSAQRLHVWNVWAGLTQPTPDGKHSIFETWYSVDEAFDPNASPQANIPRRIVRRLERPRQFQSAPGQPNLQAGGDSVFADVVVNYPHYNHIRTNRLYLSSVLGQMKQTAAVDPLHPNDRIVPAFPANAVALKPVWWPIKRNTKTALPVWDPEFNAPLPQGNPPQRWARVVAVDPTRMTVPAGETTSINFAGTAHPNSVVVGLGSFHYYELDQQAANAAQAAGFDLQVGDYMILIASHITTKEIDDWVWATVWWHDRPDVGAFAADRPVSVKGPYRNYLMAASYDLQTPKQPDGTDHVAFNPYLEARFPNGQVSNCMNCHNRQLAGRLGERTVPSGCPRAAGSKRSVLPARPVAHGLPVVGYRSHTAMT